jgi:hypothetical protein
MGSSTAGRGAIARLALSFAATAGLALASVIWSEWWFWGRVRPEDSALGFFETVVTYGLAVQVVRFVAFRWRVAASGTGAWQRIFLVGAFYGWLVEGVIVTTVIDDLPFSVSYTGLAWHALFTVLLGWWWVPRQLERPLLRSIVPLSALGIGVGTWAAFWRFEEGAQTPVLEYALFVTVTTAGYAAGLAIWWAFRDRVEPGLRGSALAILLLGGLAVLHGIANPLALLGPALVGLALVALIHTAPRTTDVPLLPTAGPTPRRSLWRLVLVPLVATAVFALITALPQAIATGWPIVIVTAPLAVLLFALSWWRARRRRDS